MSALPTRQAAVWSGIGLLRLLLLLLEGLLVRRLFEVLEGVWLLIVLNEAESLEIRSGWSSSGGSDPNTRDGKPLLSRCGPVVSFLKQFGRAFLPWVDHHNTSTNNTPDQA